MLKKMFTGLKFKYKFFSVLTPLVMIGEVVIETLIPLIMARIVDEGISRYDINYVVRTGIIMVSLTVVSLLCGVLGGRFSSVAAFGFSHNLRSLLFNKVQSFSFSEMDRFGTGSLVTRLTTDVTNIQNAFQNLIRSMVRSPFMLISGTVMACFINLRLAMIFFITIPVLAAVLVFIVLKAYPRFSVMFKKYDRLNTVVQESLIAMRVVKSFVREDFEQSRFEQIAGEVRDSQVRAEKIVVLNLPVMQIVIYLCIAATLWFGGNMVISQTMKTGELVSFITYVTQILMSLMMLSMMLVQFILTRASVDRVMEILNMDCSETDSDNTETVKIKDSSIDFEHVYFSYDGRKENCVLSDINLSIPAGCVCGIIGGTGSSKTTLVSLIPRLYDSLEGTVKIGGVDVKKLSHRQVRSHVSMVLQNNVLFSGTIAENLRWGNSNATQQQLEQACIAADAHEFIISFPDMYETELGQGGVNLSGGQKQRLCIARSLLSSPDILIFDDSTSAVDTATDSRIRTALRQCLPGTTKLIIAQRISSVQDADMIVVLNDGKIAGTGTHSQLLSENSIYREVYESQQSKN